MCLSEKDLRTFPNNRIASLSPSFRTQKIIPKKGSPLPKGTCSSWTEKQSWVRETKSSSKLQSQILHERFFWFFLMIFRTYCTVLTNSTALEQKPILVLTRLYPDMEGKEQHHHMFKEPKQFSQLKYLSPWHLGTWGVTKAHRVTPSLLLGVWHELASPTL